MSTPYYRVKSEMNYFVVIVQCHHPKEAILCTIKEATIAEQDGMHQYSLTGEVQICQEV